MAVDGTPGAKNQPHFLAGGGFEDWVDLGAVSDYAADVGNLKERTTAERVALTGADRWDGLHVYDKTLDQLFVWDGSAWVASADKYNVTGAPTVSGVSQGIPGKAQIIRKIHYVQAVTNTSGVFVLTFPTPFPNGIAHFTATTMLGSAVNPVVSSLGISKSSVSLFWNGLTPGAEIRFSYEAVGW